MNRVLKKFISILLAVLLIGGCTIQWNTIIASAEETGEIKTYENFKYVVNGDEVTITEYIGEDVIIIIPDEIEGKSVTSIGDSAFYDCRSLTSINIPDGVTSIGYSAFGRCSSLTSISIPSSVTSIGDFAFEYCSSLTSISIPSSVKSIETYAFVGCSSLTSISIPSSVTRIGDSAFVGCSSLTSIRIPSSVTSIGNYAFLGCDGLISINVDKNNKNYTSINGVLLNKNKDTILRCPLGKVGKIVIPSSVTSIGEYAFSGCSSLTSINIPDGVTSIGDYAFGWCSSLTSINISDGVTSIGDYAFYDCSSLTSISIPSSVTSIGYAAFSHCSSLTSINISDGVTSIGYAAFEGCDKLTIKAYYNSYAEKYAKENNIKFQALKVEKLINKSEISSQTITLGSSITIKGIGSGGVGPYKYRYASKKEKDSKWTLLKAYTDENTFKFTPKEVGTYEIGVRVKDSTEKVVCKIIKVIVKPKLMNASEVSSQTITLGDSITIRGVASGGVGHYKYRYASKKEKDSKWTLLKAYTTENTFKFTPKEVGTYEIGVRVKDSTEKVVCKIIKVIVNPKPLVNESEVSSQTITLGSSITIKGIGSGGIGPYKYRYASKKEKDSKWTLLKAYTDENTFKFTPKEVGTYEIGVRVKDSTEKVVCKIIKVIVNPKPLVNKSEISSQTITLGDSITIRGLASGGVGHYKYRYASKNKKDSKWTLLKAYTDKNTFKFTPKEVGTYEIGVRVKDSTEKVVCKIIKVTVKSN